MKFYMSIIFGVALVLPLASFANSNLAMQTQAIKLDELRNSMQLQIDALNTTLETFEKGLNDCSSTTGIYDPERDVCKDLEYQRVLEEHMLSHVNCTLYGCNSDYFTMSSHLSESSTKLQAFVKTWPNKRYYVTFNLDDAEEQTLSVFRQATGSGNHGIDIYATYYPDTKRIRFYYTTWGDGISNHTITERGIKVTTPRIVEIERPVRR